MISQPNGSLHHENARRRNRFQECPCLRHSIVESIENLPRKKDYDNLLSNRDFRLILRTRRYACVINCLRIGDRGRTRIRWCVGGEKGAPPNNDREEE